MDRKQAVDHPANVLERYNEQIYAGVDWMEGERSENDTLDAAIRELHEYELAAGVTFVALGNKKLERVRKAYVGLLDSPARRAEPVFDLMRTIGDLLGLED